MYTYLAANKRPQQWQIYVVGSMWSIHLLLSGGLPPIKRFSCARFIRTVCTRRIRWSCVCLTSITQRIHWIQLKHLLLRLCRSNVLLYLSPMSMQLLIRLLCCLAREWAPYCTVLYGALNSYSCRRYLMNGIFWDRSLVIQSHYTTEPKMSDSQSTSLPAAMKLWPR